MAAMSKNKKTKPGEGIRHGEGKSTWIHMADYNRAKRLAKKQEPPVAINRMIALSLKEYEMAHP